MLLPPRPNRFLKKEFQDEDDLADVIAYRHWTQGNELLEGTAASYMMALRLDKVLLPSHDVLTTRPQILRSRRALGCPLSKEQKDLYV